MTLSPELARGREAFNRGDYFDAHEHWEDHWGSGPGAERDLVYGLIKMAVALHHLERGNLDGFTGQLDMGLPHLTAHADVLPELDVEALAEEMDSLRAAIRFHGDADGLLEKERPRLKLRDAP